jgi:UDP-N-acetylmuramoyl-L-alanyl-D-glutamate--2,6-diaminopimelate ligase
MQLINNGPKQPMVIVDFAHTPDALAQVIEVIRQHCSGAVTVVFGCGGERDKGKRGEMGSAASRLANRIIVTDDNPRNEDPQAIIDDILAGIASRSTVEVERDRAKAIELAIQGAAAGDAVLIAGKGSERNQLIADAWLPFCDAEVAASILREVS